MPRKILIPKFTLTFKDTSMLTLIKKTDQKILAVWAIECVKRVMPNFVKKYPKDKRPQEAIKVLKKWVKTGEFKMAVIRKASLDSHAAARDAGKDYAMAHGNKSLSAAQSVARAAGQAVATVHVPLHAYGAGLYAQQAVHRKMCAKYENLDKINLAVDAAVKKERDWQYQNLLKLRKKL